MFPDGMMILGDGALGTGQMPWLLAENDLQKSAVGCQAPPTGFEPVLPP